MLFLATVLSVLSNGSANAATKDHDQGIRLFSTTNPSLVFTATGTGVTLAPISADPAGKWDVIADVPILYWTDYVYRNKATGTCLAAQSPLDGVALVLAACDPGDTRQQWDQWVGEMTTESDNTRCARAESLAAGARLYYDTCDGYGTNAAFQFTDRFRVKLSIVAGDNQQIKSGTAGVGLGVKVTDEDGNPLAGITVGYQLEGPWFGEDYSVPPVRWGPNDNDGFETAVTNAQGIATSIPVQAIKGKTGAFLALLSANYHTVDDLFVLSAAQFNGTVVK